MKRLLLEQANDFWRRLRRGKWSVDPRRFPLTPKQWEEAMRNPACVLMLLVVCGIYVPCSLVLFLFVGIPEFVAEHGGSLSPVTMLTNLYMFTFFLLIHVGLVTRVPCLLRRYRRACAETGDRKSLFADEDELRQPLHMKPVAADLAIRLLPPCYRPAKTQKRYFLGMMLVCLLAALLGLPAAIVGVAHSVLLLTGNSSPFGETHEPQVPVTLFMIVMFALGALQWRRKFLQEGSSQAIRSAANGSAAEDVSLSAEHETDNHDSSPVKE